jgi:hypothetical protein
MYARDLFWQGFFHDRYLATIARRHGLTSVRVRATFLDGHTIFGRASAPVSQGYG